MCQFYEEMLETGYNRYRSVADETRYVGLNRKGRPLKVGGKINMKCLNFIKYNSYFNIAKHNDIVGRKTWGQNTRNHSAIILRHHKLEGKRVIATTSTTIKPPPGLLYPRFRHHHRRGGWRYNPPVWSRTWGTRPCLLYIAWGSNCGRLCLHWSGLLRQHARRNG